MRKLFAVSLILAAIVLSVLMLTGPSTAQAGPALPSRLLAGTATPTPAARNSFPPSGAVPPTASAPNTFPPSGGSSPNSGAGALLGLGGVLLAAGVLVVRRRKTN